MKRRLNVWLGLGQDGLPYFKPLSEFSTIKRLLWMQKGIKTARATLTYDDGKPAPRKRKGGGK